MRTISTTELKSMQDASISDFRLINVLPVEKFTETLIPGAQSIPLDDPEFTSHVEGAIGGKDRAVVLYCERPDCPEATEAALRLEGAGFSDVLIYKEGAAGWQEQNQQAAMNVGS